MKVLIGCEESQVVTRAFRDRGHEAWSCDLVETRGNPDWHIQGDIMEQLNIYAPDWDLIILHPPCTALSLSGNAHYGKGMKKHKARIEAIDWTVKLWDEATRNCKHVVLENPASVIFKHIGPAAYFETFIQYIQPYQFGHMEQKMTGLAVHGLPELKPTNDVYGQMMKLPKKEREKKHYMSPGPNRSRDRSETYLGIADAFADQWGAYIDQNP